MNHKDQMDDAGLVALANEGDGEALAVLYRRHCDWVASVACKLLNNADDALDVLQDSFAYFFCRFPGFELTSSLRAYLYPVVKNQAISLIRKQKKVVSIDGRDDAASLLQMDPQIPGEFSRIIHKLCVESKEVLFLRYVLGMKLDEIAVSLKIPEGTVKSRLHNALKILKKQHFK